VAQQLYVEIEVPVDIGEFRLPEGVDERLQDLLDRQDRGEELSPAERKEAEGLVDLAEFLSLLRLRARRISREERTPQP
jgi:hypothetical protein